MKKEYIDLKEVRVSLLEGATGPLVTLIPRRLVKTQNEKTEFQVGLEEFKRIIVYFFTNIDLYPNDPRLSLLIFLIRGKPTAAPIDVFQVASLRVYAKPVEEQIKMTIDTPYAKIGFSNFITVVEHVMGLPEWRKHLRSCQELLSSIYLTEGFKGEGSLKFQCS